MAKRRAAILGADDGSKDGHGQTETPKKGISGLAAPPTVKVANPNSTGVGKAVSPDRVRRTAVLPQNVRY